ncbi:HEPN domain-containing protein [Aestuariivivens sediminis]|uniref:HEPN domain-containing protein n=1 Tax=Aestuariivivens sediminis TaxID=2913557 RepID=UPI001F563969|nr:HEPN domain-containing protein [Aestuariivivens sediminis]
MKNQSTQLFEKAFKNLTEANKELYRPEEDIIAYSICKNSQMAIMNFLKGYLSKRGVNPDAYKTIDQLFDKCKTLNKNFEKIDLSNLNCTNHEIDSRYCHEVSKINTCFATANNLYAFLKDEKELTS